MSIKCRVCGNKRKFIQYSAGNGVKRVLFEHGDTIKAGPMSAFEAHDAGKDGLYCYKCGNKFSFSNESLEELGVPKIGRYINETFSVSELIEKVNSQIKGVDASVLYRCEDEKEPEYCEINVSDPCKEALKRLGINRFYKHQGMAIRQIREGKNVVIQTKTASGKSLCFQVPVLEDMWRSPAKPSAIFIFPTKALAYDQLSKLDHFTASDDWDGSEPILNIKNGASNIKVVNINRDTKDALKRSGECYSADILITNPDFIHANMFAHFFSKKGGWGDFFRRLKYVVVDEAHQYRGVFGANTALLFRRLNMICEHMGSNPQYVCCSATLSNPRQHAEKLTGKPFGLVDEDGAPRHKRHFFLLNPAEKEYEEGGIKATATVALNLLLEKEILFNKDYQVQSIVFGRSRKSVSNIFNRTKRAASRLSERLGISDFEVGNLFASFMGTYADVDRRILLDRLKSKEIAVMFSTNALELGIDVSSVSCTLIFDYPGTSVSLLQQMGRAGRDRESLSFLILKNEPLQQYFFRNPDYFFRMLNDLEPAVLNYENEELLEQALTALKLEEDSIRANFSRESIAEYFGEDSLKIWDAISIEEIKDRGKYYLDYGMRSSSSSFLILCGNDEIGRIDEISVAKDLHPEALWENNNGVYRSVRIDYDNRVVTVKQLDNEPDYYTVCAPSDDFEVKNEEGGEPIFRGKVLLTREFKEYYEVTYSHDKKQHRWVNGVRSIQRMVNAKWLKFSKAELGETGIGAVTGLRNLLSIWIPQRARCDRNDISCEYQDYGDEIFLFAFDNFLAGTGYSEILSLEFYGLLTDCLAFVKSCDCENGCPKCLYLTTEFDNENVDKKATINLLERLLSSQA